jgi:hypothetical protein
MKTSNKLLLAAALLVTAYCVASAFALKKEFIKGDYKSRFYKMTNLKITDFDAIDADIPNSNINIEYGDKFAVWVNKELQQLAVTKKGKTLIISYQKNDNPSHGYGSSIIIICPKLSSLKLGKTLTEKEKIANRLDPSKTNVDGAFNTITGFKQDAMKIEINNATSVNLSQINIAKFHGVANWGKLSLVGPNKIDSADFEIYTHSSLTLDDAEINHPKYKLDGIAKLSVSGSSLDLLQKR